MTIDRKTYKKIISSEISLHNFIAYQRAVESAYNNYDFEEAEKGIYKLLSADFNAIKDYYIALKICFLAEYSSDNLLDALKQLFNQDKSLKYLSITCAINFLVILYLMPQYPNFGFLPYIVFLTNLIILFFLMQRTRYKRLIMCTKCNQYIPIVRLNYGKQFCLRCGRYLESNLKEESISTMEKKLAKTGAKNENLKNEYDKIIIEMNEFINLFEQEKSIKIACMRMNFKNK